MIPFTILIICIIIGAVLLVQNDTDFKQDTRFHQRWTDAFYNTKNKKKKKP